MVLLKKEIIRGLKIAAGITGGFILLVIILPGIAGSFLGQNENDLPPWLTNALIADRKDLLRSDAFRSLVFILLSAGVILVFIFDKLRKGYAILIIALLIVLDLWTVDKRYLDADRFERPAAIQKSFTPSVADAFILKDPSQHRVLNLGVHHLMIIRQLHIFINQLEVIMVLKWRDTRSLLIRVYIRK